MVKVYGYSDDTVEIEGTVYEWDEIGCYNRDVRIAFKDGTVIRIGYPKENIAVWWIRKEIQGVANQTLTVCDDEDADVYSDVFLIDSDVETHWIMQRDSK